MILTNEQIRGLYLVTIVASLPLTLLIGTIAGTAAGIWLESWVAFFLVLGAIVIGMPVRRVKKSVAQAFWASRILSESVTSALDRVDYIATGGRGAIAVDANSRRIAIAGINEKAAPQPAIAFNADTILNFKAYKPGLSMIDVRSSGNGFEAASDFKENLNAQFEAASRTGLFFTLDDILHPLVMVQMHYDDAEKWLLLIKKVKEASLDTQPSPLTYPVSA